MLGVSHSKEICIQKAFKEPLESSAQLGYPWATVPLLMSRILVHTPHNQLKLKEPKAQ